MMIKIDRLSSSRKKVCTKTELTFYLLVNRKFKANFQQIMEGINVTFYISNENFSEVHGGMNRRWTLAKFT